MLFTHSVEDDTPLHKICDITSKPTSCCQLNVSRFTIHSFNENYNFFNVIHVGIYQIHSAHKHIPASLCSKALECFFPHANNENSIFYI